MNFDLFADPEPVAVTPPVTPPVTEPVTPAVTPATAPATAPKPARRSKAEWPATIAPNIDPADSARYVLTPTGTPNRWTYGDDVILYDYFKDTVPGRGRWSSVEGIGMPELRGDTHAEVCRAIDARRAP